MEGDFEFIVVGAGTAGCVIAARLASAGRRVLLMEAGGKDASPWIHIPVGYARLLGNPKYNWMYSTEPEAGLKDRVLDQPCGRVIGGTGSINGLLHVTGQPEDYERWRAKGLAGWGWDDVSPWFGRLAVPVARVPQSHPLADAFIDAAVQAGHRRNEEGFIGGVQEGAGYYRINTRGGRRASTATEYLRPLRSSAKLRIVKHALAKRVLFEKGRAVGVEYRQAGVLRTARASAEIVVAAGAFNSPQLLEASGIGAGSRLQAIGVPVVRDVPHVGENLQNHFRASVVARCSVPTDNDALGSAWLRIAHGLRYALFRDGLLAVGTSAGGFFRSSREAATPDIQVTFWPYSVSRRGASGVELHSFPGLTANAVMLRPESRGSVHAKSADTAVAPEIRYNFLSEEADRRTIVAGVRLVRDIFARPALARVIETEQAPGAARSSDADLLDYAREQGNSVYHPVGTCAMGRVVDERLRVLGVDALRVADASVMPSLPSGNTNAPTMMIAERAAHWMLQASTTPGGAA